MKQTWTSDDGQTFDSEAECKKHEDENREFLENVISYVLVEAKECKAYSEKFNLLLENIGVRELADNILHIENFCSLVADLRANWEDTFFEWKNDDEYANYPSFWPTERWMDESMFKEYPLTDSGKSKTQAGSASCIYKPLAR